MRTNQIVAFILAFTVLLSFAGVSLADAKREEEIKPKTVVRSAGGYSVTIKLSSGAISSVLIMHGKERYSLPKDLYTDIKNPHLGKDFTPADFRLDITNSKAFVRIKAGDRDLPEDHAWVMPLPLKTVSRITRVANKTGYHEAHSSTALESKATRAE